MASALSRHTANVYAELVERATEETVGDRAYLVFRGKVKDVWASCDVPQTYYTALFQELVNQGCITKLQQGARGSDTVIVLHHAPGEVPRRELNPPRDLTTDPAFAKLVQTVDDLRRATGGFDLVKTFKEIESRLVALETLTGKGNKIG